MKRPIRVGVLGATGRMGHQVCDLIKRECLTPEITKGTEISQGPLSHRGSNLETMILDSDVIIDFSSPEAVTQLQSAALKVLAEGRSTSLPSLVIGSTGWGSQSPQDILRAYSENGKALISSNFSTGVLALTHLVRLSAPLFKRLGYTPTLIETHHRHKKDAPSGTALSIRNAMAPSFGNGAESVEVPTLSIRAGEIIGEHELRYYGTSDELWFGHRAQDRSLFARGALHVAVWLTQQTSQKNGWVPIERFLQGP
jgi:4-hydroxy-tetrahydrodipicolinate reductase